MKIGTGEPIVSDGQERFRRDRERKIREKLLRRHRSQLDDAGPQGGPGRLGTRMVSERVKHPVEPLAASSTSVKEVRARANNLGWFEGNF